MTKLQVTINNLKESISVGNILLSKLEIQQVVTEKPRVPEFPSRFSAAKDAVYSDRFVIGLQDELSLLKKHNELPPNFLGRTCFKKEDIRQIIEGLQTLLGDSDA